MAADVTANRTAHVTVPADTNYTVHLTGAGSYATIIGHSHGTQRDIYYCVAGREADLPTLTGGADGERVFHSDERIRIPLPRNDVWVRFFTGTESDVSIELETTSY